MDDRGLTAFLQELYAAAPEPGGWEGVAASAARLMDASSCSLQLQDQARGEVDLAATTQNFHAKALEIYRDHYNQPDEWKERYAKLGFGEEIKKRQGEKK